MFNDWQPLDDAPHDGTVVRIRGLRFRGSQMYYADAVWTTRRCPEVEAEGWFPPSDCHDGAGPYSEVLAWKSAGAVFHE
jgi:hypothetical protein